LNDPRKHHYVPVFYQKHFANAKGLLWVYDRKLQTYKELHPDVICFERDLYAMKPDAAPKDQRVESMALSLADGYCATAVRELVPGDQPALGTLVTIAYFAGLQSSRLPSAGKFISAIYKKRVEEMDRIASVSVERMQSMIDSYVERTGKQITVSAESMVEVPVEVVIREIPFLRHIFQYATFLNKQFLQFSWEILVASPDPGFILCDDPVVIVPLAASPQSV
jgi:hypothetical protein